MFVCKTMIWGVESCSFANLTTKPEGLTSVKSLTVLLKTFKFCGARMQFISRDKMLGLGANIHQNMCLLNFYLLPVLNYTLNFITLMVTPVVEA